MKPHGDCSIRIHVRKMTLEDIQYKQKEWNP